jgi:hypothetical protein
VPKSWADLGSLPGFVGLEKVIVATWLFYALW